MAQVRAAHTNHIYAGMAAQKLVSRQRVSRNDRSKNGKDRSYFSDACTRMTHNSFGFFSLSSYEDANGNKLHVRNIGVVADTVSSCIFDAYKTDIISSKDTLVRDRYRRFLLFLWVWSMKQVWMHAFVLLFLCFVLFQSELASSLIFVPFVLWIRAGELYCLPTIPSIRAAPRGHVTYVHFYCDSSQRQFLLGRTTFALHQQNHIIFVVIF